MALITWIVYLVFLKYSFCEDCVIDNRTPDFSWEVKLHDDLLDECKYSSYLPPKNGSEAIKVAVYFILRQFSFNDNEDTLLAHTWVTLNWTDSRLKWNPDDYTGIKDIMISSFSIWTPGLRLYNSMDADQFDFLYCRCRVTYLGEVTCKPRLLYEAACNTKLKEWPFDSQQCTLHFGEWTKAYTKVDFKLKGYIWQTGFGKGWKIVEEICEENTNKTEQISITFYMQREAQELIVFIVVPSIVVCILTLTSLILVADDVRLFISCFSLLLHYYILEQISDWLPKHSVDTPVILLFVRSSIVLTLLSIILTCVLRYINSVEKPIYAWVKTVNESVYESKYQYLIWPRWKIENSVLKISENLEITQNGKEWLKFANVLNHIFIPIFITLYSMFFIIYMPKNMFTPY